MKKATSTGLTLGIGFYALICPSTAEYPDGSRAKRRADDAALKKAKEVWVPGKTLAEFGTMLLVDQFYHLRNVIPDKWRPLSFKEKPVGAEDKKAVAGRSSDGAGEHDGGQRQDRTQAPDQ